MSREQWREEETLKGDWGETIYNSGYKLMSDLRQLFILTSVLIMNIHVNKQNILNVVITSSLKQYSVHHWHATNVKGNINSKSTTMQ